MTHCRPCTFLCVAIIAVWTSNPAFAQHEPSFDNQDFQTDVRPLLQKFCFECHAEDRLEAEVDMGSFKSLKDLQQKPSVWQRVDKMLQTAQMPPIESEQPSDEQRSLLRKWVRGFLIHQARAHQGDPGPVVLRRLSNAEYTYTIRDLTGVPTLDPAKEFPIDGAAGEGFTNAGSGLVMSPSLVQKYLAAAKQISQHAALMPDGIRFTEYTSQRDLTDDAIRRVREFYDRYTSSGGGASVNLQGIKFDTNQGGLLPLEAYLKATLEQREAVSSGMRTIEQIAADRNLSAKYLGRLWRTLGGHDDDHVVMNRLRKQWRSASGDDLSPLVSLIQAWQQRLWKFNVVGHLGREGAPTSWMEPTLPIHQRREFRLKLAEAAVSDKVTVYLSAGDAGDGDDSDFVLWRDMRLETKGKPAIKLRDVAGINRLRKRWHSDLVSNVKEYLDVIAELNDSFDIDAVAKEQSLNPAILRTWLRYLKLTSTGPVVVESRFTNKISSSGGYAFVKGWGSAETPSIVANSSDQEVRIPGISRAHGVVIHPSPTLYVAVGWQSPIDGKVQVAASIADAHPECGNGVQWLVQHRSGSHSTTLASGDFPATKSAKMEPKEITVRKGELVSLLVGPRSGNHYCDLTAIDFTIKPSGGNLEWDLAADVSPDIHAGNPHADRHGNPSTWHFYSGAMEQYDPQVSEQSRIPPDSGLAKWLQESDQGKRQRLSTRIAELVMWDQSPKSTADATLYRQIRGLTIPPDDPYLLEHAEPDRRFGVHPLGHVIDPDHVVVKAHSTLSFEIPSELARDRELVVAGMYGPEHGGECSVQLLASTSLPSKDQLATQPVICKNDSEARKRIEAEFNRFRELFPPALCYWKIVPVDEVVTAVLFHREDDLLQQLMLTADESRTLDRIWQELVYVSEAPLQQVVALEQIRAFSTQDRQDLVGPWDKLKPSVLAAAEEFRAQVHSLEPIHVSSVTSPSFLYRQEDAPDGKDAQPVDDFQLANRLSYFLWASQPDQRLSEAAANGVLAQDDATMLLRQTRLMLKDEKIRRMAVQFACQWLHLRNFDSTVEKNESLYPQFGGLRGDMYQETVLFFDDLIRNDRSILAMFDSDHSFLNEKLAEFYGIENIKGSDFRKVTGMRRHGRGGLFGMSTVLASQSGASRTSPILRGNWVSETLLGQRLPRPPANVPQLPDSVPEGLSARQLIQHHSSTPACARCHQRIDPYGFALEQFDTTGRVRPEKADVKTQLPDGTTIEGIDGLRRYLLTTRRSDVVRQFCRKLLGYALGRGVRLSDESLLQQMQSNLAEQDFRFSAAVETIVLSKQFRQIRGRDFVDPDTSHR